MAYTYLKKFRVVISLVFLILTGVFFLDLAGLFPPGFITGVLYLQFVPSLLKFLSVFSVIAAGFIIVLVLTLLFGRVYCSTICPLGIMQDVIIYLKNKFKKRKSYRFNYIRSWPWLRYPLLGVAAAFFLAGNILILALLDPYSIFGRITSNLFRPVLSAITNGLADILKSFGIYSLYMVDIHAVHYEVLIVPLVFLILIIWMTLARGRLYCNTVCPVGTFLGLLSKISVFQIKLNETTCTMCGRCERTCKAECIDYRSLHVDFSRCVGCFNCLAVCPESSADYRLNTLYLSKEKAPAQNPRPDVGTGRRRFMGGFLLTLLGVSKLAKAQELITSNATTRVERKHPVSPPGARSTGRFNQACTACHLCVNVCPTDVLQPAVFEYGYRGLMQPRLDNHTGFCNYECTLCGDVCPTGAILPISQEDKILTQIGRARFVKSNCIVETEGTDCGSCAEHCPTQAVRMVDYVNGLMIPEVYEDICIGCGACEYACPTKPFKAIYVEGNPVHARAKKPGRQRVEEVEHEDEFPF